MYGQNNSGPAREVWRDGDRVRLMGFTGTVSTPGWRDRERNAGEIQYVFVRWDDGEATYTDPNALNPFRL